MKKNTVKQAGKQTGKDANRDPIPGTTGDKARHATRDAWQRVEKAATGKVKERSTPLVAGQPKAGTSVW